MKEYFWTEEESFAQSENARIELVKGVKHPYPVLTVSDDPSKPDYLRVQQPKMFYDKYGSMFGVPGRMHCLYYAIAASEITNDVRHHQCYAYSDDLENWIKPNIGRFTFQGSKNNNIVIQGRIRLFFDPSDPTYPIKGIGDDASAPNPNWRQYRGKSFDSIEVGETANYRGVDFWETFHSQGKVRIIYHVHLSNESGKRILGVDETDTLFPLTGWRFGYQEGGASEEDQEKLRYKARTYSNVLPQRGTHSGEFLMDGKDLHGEFVLFAPESTTNTSEGLYWQPSLAKMRNFTEDELFDRIRGNDDDLILNVSDEGWDQGTIAMASNGIVETDDEMIIFYNGWKSHYTAYMTLPRDEIVMQVGFAKWRKDGLTKAVIDPGGYFTTKEMNHSGMLRVNHVGSIKVIRNGEETEIHGDSIDTEVFEVQEGDTLEFHNVSTEPVEIYSFEIYNPPVQFDSEELVVGGKFLKTLCN